MATLHLGNESYGTDGVNGAVGIGTTNPSALLQLGVHSNSIPANTYLWITGGKTIRFGTSDSDADYGPFLKPDWNDSNNDALFTIGQRYDGADMDAITIKGNSAGGWVGIGTTSPGAKLHLRAPDASGSYGGTIQYGTIGIVDGTGSDYPARLSIIKSNGLEILNFGGSSISDEAAVQYDPTTHKLAFKTNGTDDRAIIDGSGYVGIGVTDPGQKLDVDGNARFRSIGSASSSNMPLYVTTNVNSGTLSISSSDRRKKKDVTRLKNSLEKVTKLKGVNFRWKASKGKEKQIGMIAQEVEKVLPELVYTNPTDGFKGIRYAEMTAVLVEAIKEQQARIEALEKKLSKKSKKKENR